MKESSNKKIKLLIFFPLDLWQYDCENQTDDELWCEKSTLTRGHIEIECKHKRNINSHYFQQTWFTKQERSGEYFGTVFGNKTGVIFYPGIERDGSDCIDDKTIIFKNDNPDFPVEKMKIIKLNETQMILKFENGDEVTYYNPR